MKILRQLLILIAIGVLGLLAMRDLGMVGGSVVAGAGGFAMAWWDIDEIDRKKVRKMVEMVEEGTWG